MQGFSSTGSPHRVKSRAVVNLTETATSIQAWCLLSRWLPGHPGMAGAVQAFCGLCFLLLSQGFVLPRLAANSLGRSLWP